VLEQLQSFTTVPFGPGFRLEGRWRSLLLFHAIPVLTATWWVPMVFRGARATRSLFVTPWKGPPDPFRGCVPESGNVPRNRNETNNQPRGHVQTRTERGLGRTSGAWGVR
jgi:hypothetical protein